MKKILSLIVVGIACLGSITIVGKDIIKTNKMTITIVDEESISEANINSIKNGKDVYVKLDDITKALSYKYTNENGYNVLTKIEDKESEEKLYKEIVNDVKIEYTSSNQLGDHQLIHVYTTFTNNTNKNGENPYVYSDIKASQEGVELEMLNWKCPKADSGKSVKCVYTFKAAHTNSSVTVTTDGWRIEGQTVKMLPTLLQ